MSKLKKINFNLVKISLVLIFILSLSIFVKSNVFAATIGSVSSGSTYTAGGSNWLNASKNVFCASEGLVMKSGTYKLVRQAGTYDSNTATILGLAAKEGLYNRGGSGRNNLMQMIYWACSNGGNYSSFGDRYSYNGSNRYYCRAGKMPVSGGYSDTKYWYQYGSNKASNVDIASLTGWVKTYAEGDIMQDDILHSSDSTVNATLSGEPVYGDDKVTFTYDITFANIRFSKTDPTKTSSWTFSGLTGATTTISDVKTNKEKGTAKLTITIPYSKASSFSTGASRTATLKMEYYQASKYGKWQIQGSTTGEAEDNSRTESSSQLLEAIEWKTLYRTTTVNIDIPSIMPKVKINVIKKNPKGETLPGAEFDVTVKPILTGSGETKHLTSNTSSSNTLEFTPKSREDLYIRLDETEAPEGYIGLEEDEYIVLVCELDGSEWVVLNNEEELPEEVTNIDVTTSNDATTITLTVENKPIRTLVGGMVFNDEQFGQEKDGNFRPQNGVYDEGEALAGVFVELLENGETIATTYSARGGEVISYKNQNGVPCTKTLSKGEYFFYEAEGYDYLPVGDYTVQFTYNGQKFTTVEQESGGSNADEQGRNSFNSSFRTINAESDLEYDSEAKDNINDVFNSNLVMYETGASWSGTTEKNIKNLEDELREEFKIQATANVDSEDWKDVWTDDGEINEEGKQLNVNCGLRERKLDLSLTDDVQKVEVKINGKSTTYNYAQVLKDGALDNLGGDALSDDIAPTYNQYIYESDYNFRISDYAEGLINNKVNSDEEDIEDNVTEDDELKVYVTYTIKPNLQTMTENGTVKVNTIRCIYQSDKYKLVDENHERVYEEDEEPGEIEVSLEDESSIDLTFEVLILDYGIDSFDEEEDIKGANKAEIIEYYSEDGLIDRDSKPGNIDEQYEDDSDVANGITYTLYENKTREISGYVWDDSNRSSDDRYNGIGDGTKTDSEKYIDDVLVQLIEIKPIEILGTTYNLEYIWQETRSGSKKGEDNDNVTAIDLTNTGYDYYGVDNNSGYYKFTDFIPGNYIVRFIYGDGSTVTVDGSDFYESENVQKYNGQDYKSTKYEAYNKEWYNTESYNRDISVARDNEARRLEVMKYSVLVDENNGADIKEKNYTMLDETWMCAETLKINVPVEDNVKFDKINFGLEKRPETKIELEKHITALSVNTQDGKILLDAKVENMDNILDETKRIIAESDKKGVTKGLTTLVSTRDNRNFWKLETDLSELGQGSEMNAEYTYVVKNVGDNDYLSDYLVSRYDNAISSFNIENYIDELEIKAGEIKTAMRNPGFSSFGDLLGTYYYTGNKTGVSIVPTQVNEIQEALNNQLTFVEGDFVSEGSGIGTIWRNVPNEGITDVSENINNIIKTVEGTKRLEPGQNDTDKTVKLQATITTDGGSYDSYIAEIISYTNAAGRVDMNVSPNNLTYVHSDDPERTLNYVPDGYPEDELANEHDEFWGESIVISKPTGEDKITPVQITLVSVVALAIIGTGIILIKKFVIKK